MSDSSVFATIELLYTVMRTLFRNTIVHTAALYALPYVFAGVTIAGGFPTYLLGGILLTIMGFTVKPILGIISFPLNLITMGLFSAITNAIILYLLTVILPKIKIEAFLFEGVRFAGFVIPEANINTFFAYVLSAMLIAVIMTVFNWLIK